MFIAVPKFITWALFSALIECNRHMNTGSWARLSDNTTIIFTLDVYLLH